MSEENQLYIVEWVNKMALVGFGVTRDQIVDAVKCVHDKNNLSPGFKNNRPCPTWVDNLIEKHKLSLRKPEDLDKSRALVARESIQTWFEVIFNGLKYFNI